jgi:hypothetical protein
MAEAAKINSIQQIKQIFLAVTPKYEITMV